MMSSLEINGKKLHRIKFASEQTGYSRDYITRLAREQKIVASQIGRHWFVDLTSLGQYASAMLLEQKARQQKLSDERKQERQLSERIEKKEVAHELYKRRLALRSKLLATAVLSVGLLAGFALEKSSFVPTELDPQVASVPFMQWFGGRDSVQETQSIKVAATPANAEVVDFSQEAFSLATLAEPTDGVLLLPASQNASSSDVRKLFSDDVSVLRDENGQQYVAQVGAKGEVIRKIPFVVVPVNPPPPTP